MIKEKNDLIRKFSLYSIVIIVILGIILNLVISYKIENMVMERTKYTTSSIVEINTRNYHLNDMIKENDSKERKNFFEAFYNSLKTDDIIRIKIFNTNGTIIYSDAEGLIGQIFQDNLDLNDALKGSIGVEINRDLKKKENIYERENFSGLMEIYVPIKNNSGQIEGVVELYQVLDNIERIRSKAEKKKVTIIKDIDPQLQFIGADKEKFSQILQFLLDNAVKFSKAEGGVIKIIASKTGNMAQFSISDNGIGIKEENMEKLFQVFEQIDSGISREYNGTGLGLSISMKLVELHGGKIWAQSKYGEGTIVTFQIPIESKKGGAIS